MSLAVWLRVLTRDRGYTCSNYIYATKSGFVPGLVVPAIEVRWHATDLPEFQTHPMQPGLTINVNAGTSSTTACSGQPTAPPTDQLAPNLSPGAIAGIIVGTLLLVAVFIVAAMFVRRRMRDTSDSPRVPPQVPSMSNPPDVPQLGGLPVSELDPAYKAYLAMNAKAFPDVDAGQRSPNIFSAVTEVDGSERPQYQVAELPGQQNLGSEAVQLDSVPISPSSPLSELPAQSSHLIPRKPVVKATP